MLRFIQIRLYFSMSIDIYLHLSAPINIYQFLSLSIDICLKLSISSRTICTEQSVPISKYIYVMHLSLCLFIYLYLYHSISICLCLCLSLSIQTCVYTQLYLPKSTYIYIPIYQSIYLSIFVSFYLSIHLSICSIYQQHLYLDSCKIMESKVLIRLIRMFPNWEYDIYGNPTYQTVRWMICQNSKCKMSGSGKKQTKIPRSIDRPEAYIKHNRTMGKATHIHIWRCPKNGGIPSSHPFQIGIVHEININKPSNARLGYPHDVFWPSFCRRTKAGGVAKNPTRMSR